MPWTLSTVYLLGKISHIKKVSRPIFGFQMEKYIKRSENQDSNNFLLETWFDFIIAGDNSKNGLSFQKYAVSEREML